MTTKRSPLDFALDIQNAAQKAEQFVRDVDFEIFRRSDEKVFAVVRALEIIGEAANRIPKTVQASHPNVPWREIIGMRNKVIHGYFGVDLEVVWKTVQRDLPELQRTIEPVITALKEDGPDE